MIGPECQQFQILPWQSRTLLLTSSLSVIPIYVACDRGLWFHAMTSSGTYLCSVLYWYHPIHGWRRNLDLVYAKYSFVVYFATGLMYIPIDIRSVYFLVASMAIAHAYRMTYVYPHIWIRYHILFHLLCIMTKTCILQQIPIA
jgi:hypothetical protein